MLRQPESDRSRPAANGTASKLSDDDVISIGQTLDHFLFRLLQDCVREASRSYWLKRAQDFDKAKPTPADFHGQATRETLREQWYRLDEVAQACRNKASLCPFDDVADEVDQALREAS
jgi:hypothetical protein